MSTGSESDDVQPEYDLAKLGKATRGKYFKRYQHGSRAVVIDPDLAEAFPNSKAVNDALRELLSRRGRKRSSSK